MYTRSREAIEIRWERAALVKKAKLICFLSFTVQLLENDILFPASKVF